MSPETRERELPPAELLTQEAFLEMWGEKSGFTEDQFEQLWNEAQEGYIDLPYHNWLHAREVLWATMRLADLCEEHDIPLNRRILISASLFHDFDYYKDHKAEGDNFETKEELSATIYKERMPKYGMSEEEVVVGAGTIIATTAGAEITNIYDVIMVRADLENIAGNYIEDYLRKGRLYHDELEQINKIKIPMVAFVIESMNKLSMYLSNNLNLPFEDPRNRQTVFKSQAIRNIRQDVRETALAEGQRVIEFIRTHEIGRLALKVLGYKNNKAA